jgi:hypothetical protein
MGLEHLRWSSCSRKGAVVYMLYDTCEQHICCFLRYGRSAELRVWQNESWAVRAVQGIEEDIRLISRCLGVPPEALHRARTSPVRESSGRVLHNNQWTNGPRYEDPKFDYRAYFASVHDTAPYYCVPDVIREIKRRRHAAYLDRHAYRWENQYPEDCAALQAWFAQQSEFACKDNFRVARVGDLQRMRRYAKQKAKGCCGAFDTVTSIGGMPYYVGFNYGH